MKKQLQLSGMKEIWLKWGVPTALVLASWILLLIVLAFGILLFRPGLSVTGVFHAMERFIVPLELAVGTLAVVFAVRHAHSLEDTATKMSTQSLGTFPGYVSAVTELIESAKTSITIVCDLPGCCIFSAPDLWDRYHLAIRNVIGARASSDGSPDKIKLRMAWLSEAQGRSVLTEQFRPGGATNEVWKSQQDWKAGSNLKRLKQFLATYPHPLAQSVTAETITYTKFQELIETRQREISEEFRAKPAGAEFTEVGQGLEIFFWIKDGEEAIFAVPNYTTRDKSIAFETKDKALVEALETVFERLTSERALVVGV